MRLDKANQDAIARTKYRGLAYVTSKPRYDDSWVAVEVWGLRSREWTCLRIVQETSVATATREARKIAAMHARWANEDN